MKRDINLIPKDKRLESVFMIVFRVAGLLILLGLFAVVGILYPMRKKTMLVLENNRYERELERYKGVEREFTALQQKISYIESKVKTAQKLANEREEFSSILLTIQESSPTSLQMNTLTYDMNGMVLEGWAPSGREVAQLVVHLRKNGSFEDVMINSIEAEKDDSRVRFTIQCLIGMPNIEGEEAKKEGDEA